MHLLTLETRLEIGPKEVLEPGTYIAPDIAAAQLMVIADGGKMSPLGRSIDRYFDGDEILSATGLGGSADWSGKRILIQRAGGFGDLVLLTPVLREIKDRWPSCHIGVSTMAHYGVVLANLPFVDEVLPFPILKSTADTFDAWIFYENAIEKNPRAHELHMTELFSEIAGLTGIENLLPEYRVKPSEAVWANESFPRVNGTRRVCIQVGASGRCRRYTQFGEVASQMVERGWEVMLLGTADELPSLKGKTLPPLLLNLTDRNMTFRQSCAVVNTADCFVGADSALLHVAGALAVPAVGLYGPFPWKLRTAHSPTTFAFQGTGDCAPCFHHVSATMRNHFPAHCPSASKGMCEVVNSTKPERVVAKAEQIMRKIAPMGDVIEFKPRE